MTDDIRNRKEQRTARELKERKGIKYTHALRLIREAHSSGDYSAIDALPDIPIGE